MKPFKKSKSKNSALITRAVAKAERTSFSPLSSPLLRKGSKREGETFASLPSGAGRGQKPLVFIILGRPGSGKGTQAKLLVEKFGLEYVEVGDLVRKRQKIKDFTGQKLLIVSWKKGELIPSFLVSNLWIIKFEELKQKSFKGFVLDGSPRILIESQLIDEALKWYEWQKNVKIILINISEKESIWRLTKRRTCRDCGRIIPYIGEFKKLKKCDQCQGKLIIRKDQSLGAIKKRLKEFNEKTKPAIDYYSNRLIKINGQRSIENIFQDILKAIK